MDTALHSTLRWAATTNHSHKLILGDFNHPDITWTPNPELPDSISSSNPAQQFVDCVHDTFLLQHVMQPTRYREGQRPTLDDLIFTNEREMVDNLAFRDPLGASDHVSLSFTMIFNPSMTTKTGVLRNYNKADFDAMRKSVDLDWPELLNGKSTQETADLLEKVVQETIDKLVPKI